MINFSKQVPSIYPSASRDFQYLGWLFNIVLNSVKHNVDGIYDLPIAHDDAKLSELLAMTLGFKVKRNYDKKQLAALVSILPSILRYKGTLRAIKMAAEALVKSSGATGELSYSVNKAHIDITMPEDLIDTTLFIDLLDYILPAGMTCRIIYSTQARITPKDILISFNDTMQFVETVDLGQDSNTNLSVGLATLYDADLQQYTPEYITRFTLDNNTAITGLVNNTIIPVLANEVPLEWPDGDTPVLASNLVDKNGRVLMSSDNRILKSKEND